MELTINGAARQVLDGTTLTELVLAQGPSTEGVAVAVGGEIVHRTQWSHLVLTDGQTVELISAQQGG